MGPDSVYSKKDKRLLVLLALGALILLPDLNLLPSRMIKHQPSQLWLETTEPDKSLIRISSTVPKEVQVDVLSKILTDSSDKEINTVLDSLSEQQTIAFDKKPGQGGSVTRLSPRLSFYLGLPITINQASYEELLLLPGIGPYLAHNIISYRDKHGGFSGKRELKMVPGIGPKVLSKVSPLLIFN